jgi:hypothetical protein
MKDTDDDPSTQKRERLALSARIRIADEAVARIAAWPIETLAPFAAPQLAALARELADAERDIREASEGLLGELFGAVSKAGDARARSWLLEVKREVYKGLRPWRQPRAREEEILASATLGLVGRLEVERQARLRVIDMSERLAAVYESELHAQRRALRRATQSTRFARALTLANPALAARWRGQPDDDARRTKRTRHLEGAVLHYLLRAVGRATPSGAWAGVAPVKLSDSARDLDTARAALRYVAAPDLLPFRQIVERLARRPRYLEEYPLRIDPAAHHDGALWWGIGASGEWAGVPGDPLVNVITDNFADGASRPVAPLMQLLAARAGNPERMRALFERALEELIEAGVLRSSIEFPAAPPSAWDALDSVTPMLLEPERSDWVRAVERCRSACAELSADYESLAPESVERIHEEARSAVVELSRQVGAEAHLPAQIIKFDCTAPFDVHWSPRLMRRMREAVVAVLELHAEAGGGEAFRRELLAGLRGSSCTLADAVMTQADLSGRATRAGMARFGEWLRGRHEHDEGLRAKHAPPPADAGPGPYGTLIFILGGSPTFPHFTWGRAAPDFASCRAYQLLDRTERDLSFLDALHPDGLLPLEVVGVDAENPNATIRLEGRKARQVGRHAGTVASFSSLLLEVDEECRPWVRLPEEADRFVPTYSAAAGIGLTDPAGRFLVRLAMAHGWEFLSFGVPFAAFASGLEAEGPVQVLGGDSVLGLQQWVLPAGFVGELRRRSGVEQYRMWRDAVEAAGVGDWAWIGPATPPDAPRVLLRTDSPLVLETVLDRLPADCGSLALARVPGDPACWPVSDAEGNHYLCELAVTWADSEHWREVCP